jgi:hypothetical protein
MIDATPTVPKGRVTAFRVLAEVFLGGSSLSIADAGFRSHRLSAPRRSA